ncbi:DUF6538 domain-containing protein [Devosia aurantiaca]|uniref:DUF6538 domain-containing protein n=1 Tax=Devosia aurantiaca TaxID=2714858 RepID=A0A6M1SI66_9HYPH|nr:DUF6538 domain-containing protein [Devosia aurantiaca]NGP16544.1 hypothetical protein [Devosia aurantiaca]
MGEAGINTLWKRPENGTYYFRKGVPERLRHLIGKAMMQVSLRTKDLAVAKSKHKTVAAEVATQWAKLQQVEFKPIPTTADDRRTVSLSSKEVAALAGELYRALLDKHKHDAGPAKEWEAKLKKLQNALPITDRLPEAAKWTFGGPSAIRHNAIVFCYEDVEALLAKKGIALSMPDHHRLCAHAAKALAQAYEVLIRRANGDWSADPRESRFPPPISHTGWRKWYAAYCKAKLPEPSSRKRQEGVLNAFFNFLGHEIPERVTEEDANRWVEARLELVSRATVIKADLAHTRSFLPGPMRSSDCHRILLAGSWSIMWTRKRSTTRLSCRPSRNASTTSAKPVIFLRQRSTL